MNQVNYGIGQGAYNSPKEHFLSLTLIHRSIDSAEAALEEGST